MLKAVDREADELRHIAFARHVADDWKRVAAGCLYVCGGATKPITPPGANRERRTVSREAYRGCAADAGRRAGDGDHS